MDENCDDCGQPLAGTEVTKIVDGTMSHDDEFDHANTWTYHATCVTVSTSTPTNN